jgi:hypothetical protein
MSITHTKLRYIHVFLTTVSRTGVPITHTNFLFCNGCYIPETHRLTEHAALVLRYERPCFIFIFLFILKHTGGRNTRHWYSGTRDLVLFIYLFILETHRWTEHAALVLRYERLLSGRQKRRYQCSEMWEVRGEHSISKAFCTNTHTHTHTHTGIDVGGSWRAAWWRTNTAKSTQTRS